MSITREAKLNEILTVGANVTIPTISWGTWTGEIIAIRETGPLAPEDEVFVTIRDANGSEQEVRTSRNYTGYLNAPAVDAAPEAKSGPTYTVTLRAAQGGRIPHTYRGIDAEDVHAAIRDAYHQRHGADVTLKRSNIHTRNVDAGEYVIYGNNGSVTFVDVEIVAPASQVELAPIQETVPVKDVWRCGRYAARSGLAKRDAWGYVEVPQVDVDAARAAGTHLFRIID